MYISILLIFLGAGLINPSNAGKSLLLTLERSNVKLFDPKYITNCTTTVARAKRSSPYTWNLDIQIARAWHGNVSIELKTYEQRNNEYRESIIRTTLDVCLAIFTDKWISPILRKYSNLPKKCPIKVGHLTIKDFELTGDVLPMNFPIAKWRFDFKFYQSSTRKYILHLQLFFKVESNVAKKSKKPK